MTLHSLSLTNTTHSLGMTGNPEIKNARAMVVSGVHDALNGIPHPPFTNTAGISHTQVGDFRKSASFWGV